MQIDLTKYYQTISSIRQRCLYAELPEDVLIAQYRITGGKMDEEAEHSCWNFGF